MSSSPLDHPEEEEDSSSSSLDRWARSFPLHDYASPLDPDSATDPLKTLGKVLLMNAGEAVRGPLSGTDPLGRREKSDDEEDAIRIARAETGTLPVVREYREYAEDAIRTARAATGSLPVLKECRECAEDAIRIARTATGTLPVARECRECPEDTIRTARVVRVYRACAEDTITTARAATGRSFLTEGHCMGASESAKGSLLLEAGMNRFGDSQAIKSLTIMEVLGDGKTGSLMETVKPMGKPLMETAKPAKLSTTGKDLLTQVTTPIKVVTVPLSGAGKGPPVVPPRPNTAKMVAAMSKEYTAAVGVDEYVRREQGKSNKSSLFGDDD